MSSPSNQDTAKKQDNASGVSDGAANEQPSAVRDATGSGGQTSGPEQVKPQPKNVALKSDKLPQVVRRLLALGFKYTPDGRYVNPSAEANIHEIAWGRDRIEDNCVWLVVSARKPFAYTTAAMERFAQRRQVELQRRLRLAKEYWLRIQPFIKDRPLRDAELYVATDAHRRLQTAQGKAELWNSTAEGKQCPLPADTLVDFTKDEFREPEELCRDEHLKPETLAAIAAPMMQKRTAELTPLAAIGVAHELLMAAGRYVDALPVQKRGTERLMEAFDKAFSTVTFADIRASNTKNSGQLPLLPPVGQKKKGRTEQELAEKPLSVTTIRNAVRDFLNEHTPRLTKQEYERDQEQTERLAREGKLVMLGSGKRRTYQEWQSDNQKAIDDCLQNNRISLQSLCTLRWQRFEKSCQSQQNRALNRKPSKRKPKKEKSKTTLLKSAASTPVYSGKRERGKAAPVE